MTIYIYIKVFGNGCAESTFNRGRIGHHRFIQLILHDFVHCLSFCHSNAIQQYANERDHIPFDFGQGLFFVGCTRRKKEYMNILFIRIFITQILTKNISINNVNVFSECLRITKILLTIIKNCY